MILERGATAWPEAIGHPVECQGCKQIHSVFDCISIAVSVEKDGMMQICMTLVCIPCTNRMLNPLGRA